MIIIFFNLRSCISCSLKEVVCLRKKYKASRVKGVSWLDNHLFNVFFDSLPCRHVSMLKVCHYLFFFLLTMKMWESSEKSPAHLNKMGIGILFLFFILWCHPSEQDLGSLCAWSVTRQLLAGLGAWDRGKWEHRKKRPSQFFVFLRTSLLNSITLLLALFQ